VRWDTAKPIAVHAAPDAGIECRGRSLAPSAHQKLLPTKKHYDLSANASRFDQECHLSCEVVRGCCSGWIDHATCAADRILRILTLSSFRPTVIDVAGCRDGDGIRQ
jgi:hypothetical protein